MKKYLLLSTALISAAAALPVLAEAPCKDDGSTALTLSAEAHRTVQQDRLTANLNIEGTGKTAMEAQKKINEKMQAARAMYSKVSGLKVTTGGYNTWKDYPPEPAPKANGQPAWTPEVREQKAFWRANQQLNIDSADRDEVLKLVGALQQEGFAVQGMNFYLSREASDALRDELTTEALKSIKTRAQTMGKALGMSKVRYVRIDTNGAMPAPMPYNMMRADMVMAKAAGAESMPEPVAQGGESEVNINVTAEVRLSE